MNRFWNFIRNEQNDKIELYISGEILSDDDAWIYEWFGIPAASPNAFRKELAKYKGKDIVVWIDSYGGDVFAGAGIYNALKEHDGKITTKITKAMSAASVIAMAGDEIHISPVGIMMVHNPWTRTNGEAKDMRHAADVLDEVKETIVNAYQLKTGKPRNKISEMMNNETFMSANTALKEGFADEILYLDDEAGTNPIENNFSFSRLVIQNSMAGSMKKFFEIAKNNESQNDPILSASQSNASKQKLEAAITNSNQKEEVEVMYNTIEELKNAYPQLVDQIENAAIEKGAADERARIQNIEKISKNIDPALVNKAKFQEPKDAKELAFEALQADSTKAATYLENMNSDTTVSNASNVVVAPEITVASNDLKPKTVQEKLKNVAQMFDAQRRGIKKGENE